MSGNLVKVLLDIQRDDGSTELESVWAIQVETGYRLDNIPFYARGYAWGDVVAASLDPGGILRCNGLVSASAHSTIRLWFADEGQVQRVRDELRSMGCGSELDSARLVAVDVPRSVSYLVVRDYLEGQHRLGVLEYEEACLGQAAPIDPNDGGPGLP